MKTIDEFSQFELLRLRWQSTALLLLFKSVFKTICRHSWINKRRKARVLVALLAGLCFCALSAFQALGQCREPPVQAVAAGFYNLEFDEEFEGHLDIGFGTTGHKWNAGLWWEVVPPASCFQIQNGVLVINAGSLPDANLCTQFHDHSGGIYFQGGYFEARMWCTDWSAFWLFCADRPTVFGSLVLPSNPLTWTNELDIIETDPGTPNDAVVTLHANSSGDGGVPDIISLPNNFRLASQLVQAWHTYGVLWTESEVSWYVDDVKINSTAPFASTWQKVQLILTAAPGGVNRSKSTVIPPITKVKWVRVWH